MKFISWNVNGIRACVTKGFLDYFKEVDADIFCLQETKLQEGQIDLNLEGYYDYWNYAQKKGYSGTAIFTKKKPISVYNIAHNAIKTTINPIQLIIVIGLILNEVIPSKAKLNIFFKGYFDSPAILSFLA